MADVPRAGRTPASRPASWRRDAARITPTDRYGIVLALLLATFVFMASAPSGSPARVVTVALQALTLVAAASAAGAHRRFIRIVVVVAVVAFVAALASAFINTNRNGDGVFFGLNGLLVAAAPIVIARSVWRRGVVDIQTVLAAISIYVLIGMIAAFTYGAIADLSTSGFFAKNQPETTANFLYFSFVTLTTVGYGDLTAAKNLGRSFSALEGMIGQLYLVTVVALVVSRLTGRREDRPPGS
ncbi:MAG TPA: ion channel [Acidimicrobiia bacterium]|nr:ion channel [Acidimicrobiia bacterium]